MATYSFERGSSTETMMATIQSAASGVVELVEWRMGRQLTSTTNASGRTSIQRSTGGATPTNATESKYSSRSPTNAGNAVTVWGTPPTLSGSVLVYVTIGMRHEQQRSWRPPRPWAAPTLLDGEQMDVITQSGNAYRYTGVWREDTQRLHGYGRGRRPRTRGLWPFQNRHVNYAHSASSPAYDIMLPITNAYVTTLPFLCATAPRRSWNAYYDAGTPPADDHMPFPALAVTPEFPYYVEV